jgi:hypothetical protein
LLVFGFSGEGGRETNEGEQTSFSPTFVRLGEEEDPQCRSKWHRYSLFSFSFFNNG